MILRIKIMKKFHAQKYCPSLISQVMKNLISRRTKADMSFIKQ